MLPMDINQGVFILNGHVVTGWSDAEDCLTFPQELELMTMTKGADGKMVASGTGEKGGPVVLKLQPNSPTVGFIAKFIKQQQQGLPVIWSASWTSPVSGERVNCKGGALLTAPKGTTYGKGKAAEKVYTFEFELLDENPETLLFASAAGVATSLI